MAATITGTNSVSKGETHMIRALNAGAVSVAYEVTGYIRITENKFRRCLCILSKGVGPSKTWSFKQKSDVSNKTNVSGY